MHFRNTEQKVGEGRAHEAQDETFADHRSTICDWISNSGGCLPFQLAGPSGRACRSDIHFPILGLDVCTSRYRSHIQSLRPASMALFGQRLKDLARHTRPVRQGKQQLPPHSRRWHRRRTHAMYAGRSQQSRTDSSRRLERTTCRFREPVQQ